HGYQTQNFILGGNGAAQARYVNNVPTKAPSIGATTASLRGVWTADTVDQFAVGDNGTVLEFDGTSWLLLPTPKGAQPVNLHALFGTGPTSLYMAGDSGTVWSHNTTAGTDIPTGVTSNLYGVWALAGGTIYAVGQGGVLLHYRP